MVTFICNWLSLVDYYKKFFFFSRKLYLYLKTKKKNLIEIFPIIVPIIINNPLLARELLGDKSSSISKR